MGHRRVIDDLILRPVLDRTDVAGIAGDRHLAEEIADHLVARRGDPDLLARSQ